MTRYRPAWVEVDLDAVRDNVRAILREVSPAMVMAVVKADGYGHGAVPVARAALDAGAEWLGVALVEEGVELREHGIDARVLLLSEPPPEAARAVVTAGLTPVVYTEAGIRALADAQRAGSRPIAVHLKIDTGMHRVGCAPAEAVLLAKLIADRPELELEGVLTHLAVADEPEHPANLEQLARFADARDELMAAGAAPALVHVANSAALMAFPAARFDLVRAGIAVYGVPPIPSFAGTIPLRPAMSFRARVSHVKTLPAGARLSYGLHYELSRGSQVATVPVGYADGVPRALGTRGGEVLLRGRRRPIAGTVTMDQITVDAGDEPLEIGDEVVLIGRQGNEEITATEWADRLGTIAYEIVCGIGPRAPRSYH